MSIDHSGASAKEKDLFLSAFEMLEHSMGHKAFEGLLHAYYRKHHVDPFEDTCERQHVEDCYWDGFCDIENCECKSHKQCECHAD